MSHVAIQLSNVKVFTPSIPNFVRTEFGTNAIEKFTDEQLREIGKRWTFELIEKAIRRRKQKK